MKKVKYINMFIQFFFIRISYRDADNWNFIYPIVPLSGYITKNIFPRLVDYPKTINVVLSYSTILFIVVITLLVHRYFALFIYVIIYYSWMIVYVAINQILSVLENMSDRDDEQMHEVDERNKRKK